MEEVKKKNGVITKNIMDSKIINPPRMYYDGPIEWRE